jgi:polyvinyl alcohol dehydrogenase (cytochrome)
MERFDRMSNRARVFSSLLAVTLLAGCSSGNKGLSDADKAKAEALYQTNCAACHAAGEGGAPTRDALETRTPAAILAALETGLMREQGKAISPAERALVSEYLGAKSSKIAGQMCKGSLSVGKPLWNRWGNGIDNRRYQPASVGGLTPDNVGDLELKWAFAFPNAARARSQPAVTEQAIFTGSQDGRVYALDTNSGCVWWSFDADSEVRSAPTIGDDGNLYFGDFNANVYAVDATSGKLVWKQSVKDHPAGAITGSPTLHDGKLYVPMSSTEVISAMNGNYGCCTFRGGVTALDAKDGRKLWRMHTTAEPGQTTKNKNGSMNFGPSGAPVWSSPTVDAKRGLLYIGTGENYSTPANEMSDSIIALELGTGRVRWVQQMLQGDAWNASCGRAAHNNNINCPKENGPDLDFGAPPILAKAAGGRDVILAGQKSGMIYALDPENRGKLLWQQRAGMGGFNGGIHWGMASDGRILYAGIADTPGNKGAVGPPRQGMHAFDVATGKPYWSKIEPYVCKQDKHECRTALSAGVTLTDGVIFAGALNGILRAYSTKDGSILWTTDTRRDWPTVNGVKGYGGAIDSAGPVVAGGYLIVNSGYDKFGQIPGNVLLVFGPKESGKKK